jgi:4-hydroxybenzoate polyprenyltransferase
MASLSDIIKAYVDLTRLHFFFAWPSLFCSGLFLSFSKYGGFSWGLVGKAALIALFGFEAGFVLNDYVDRDIDGSDVEHDKLTKYWRVFGKRPIPSGLVSPKQALTLFLVLVAATSALILTLPYPHSVYVLGIMVYCYVMEYYYQVKKRDQSAPFAQLLGRTDFTLFPVAGYLVNGHPDQVVLLYILFFYPFAQAHLGANDIIDTVNDRVRGLKTIPRLYGMKGTMAWILGFTLLHGAAAVLFSGAVGVITKYAFGLGFMLLLGANIIIMRGKTTETWLKALPLFHLTMLIYTLSIAIDFFV